METKNLYLCSGCNKHFSAQGGYFINTEVSKNGTLTLVQVKADSGFSPAAFKHFCCGMLCSALLYGVIMDKFAGQAPAWEVYHAA